MTTIKLKNGSGAPTAGDLAQGEPALDLTNKRLYTEDSVGTVIEVGTNPGTDVTFADNRKAVFGAGSDLEIFSDGTNGRISLNSASGNLRMLADEFQLANTGYTNFYLTTTAADAVRLFHGGNQKFETTSTGIDVTGSVVIETGSGNTYPTASTSADNLVISDKTASTPVGITIFSDNASQGNIFFGDENDADNGRIVYDHNGNANTMSFYANGAERLSVDSTGIDVTGTVTADGLTVESTGATFFNAAVDAGTGLTTLKSTNNSTGGSLKIQTGGNDSLQISATGDISFYEDTGTTAKLFWDASAESLTVEGFIETPYISLGSTSNSYQTVTGSSDGNDLTYRAYQNHIFKNTTGASSSTDGTERMRIDSSGNVGIGTTSPNYNFHVTGTGDTIAAVTAGASSVAGLNLGNSTNKADGGIRYDNSADALIFRASNAEKVRIDSSGVVQIGPSGSTGDRELRFETGSGSASGEDAIINSYRSNADLILKTNDTERMRIDSSGNVGIGTGSPTEKLHVSGTASVFKQQNNVTNWTLGLDAADQSYKIKHNGTERMRIDSSGRVGIGRTPSISNSKLEVGGADNVSLINVEASGNTGGIGIGSTGLQFFHGSTAHMRIDSSGNLHLSGDITMGSSAQINASNAFYLDSDIIHFRRNNEAESARIDSSGNLLVGTTSTYSTSKMTLEYSSNTNFGITLRDSGTATTAGHFNFVKGGSVVGTIQSTSSATSYNTSSDQRLKDNIVDAPSASDDIDAIQVRSFDWKADGSHQKYGMVAQELQSVAPEAVSQGETEEDMMGVDYSKLVPMMMKEIQSLRARVAQLEGEN